MTSAYYNEIDPYAAEWLRNLMKAGLIAAGDVDERSIADVQPDDIKSYAQCHFFAGIGVWSYALRLSGWPDDRPIWTGSCPCQPFSGAGKRKGFADERHLWPVWFNLIAECRPGIILGEQVASKDGYAWFDDVQADMESLDHACGAVVTPAAGYGAPEERHRVYWSAIRLADAEIDGERTLDGQPRASNEQQVSFRGCDISGGLANADGGHTCAERKQRGGQYGQQPEDGCVTGRLDHTARIGHGSDDLEPIAGRRECPARQADGTSAAGEPATGPVNGFWRAADWLFCRDGKWRPVRPSSFPLAHGVARRMGSVCTNCGADFVWENTGMSVLRGFAFRTEGFQSPQVLRQGLLSTASLSGTAHEQKHGIQPIKESQESESLRALPFNRDFACSSQGPECSERQHQELGSPVRRLPQRRTPGGDTAVTMRRLFEGISCGVSPEPEQDLFCRMCQGMGPHIVTEEVGPPRVGRLRAYGNAIVATQAAEFAQAVMDVIDA